jgi:hypothetical protein
VDSAVATRKAWFVAYAACAALVLLFHYRLAWPGRALIANDFRALFFALRSGLQQTIKSGEWPFWQRGMFLGYPILGDIQFQLFNPLTWLTLPLDAPRGVTVQSLLELCIAAIGMAYWMKLRGLRPVEGVFAGVCFALCLKETVHLHHWTFAGSTCAWPWMFAGLDGLHRTRRIRYALLIAGGTAGTWIGSSPQMAWFGSGLAFLYALYVARELYGTQPRLALLAVASLPLGFALVAPLLLPVAELSALGPRGPGITYHFAASWSWDSHRELALMLLPRAWGGRPDYRGPLNYWEAQGYLGLLPMALFAVAPLRKKGLWIFATVLVLGVWISFGELAWLGLHRLAVHLLPGYGGFRNPTRALMLSAFCGSVLAAEGLHRLREEPQLRVRVLVALGVLAVGIGVCVAFARVYSVDSIKANAEAALWLLAACAIWAALARNDARWAAVAIALFLSDVAVQTWDSPEIGEARYENTALDTIRSAVPPAPAPRRLAVLLDWGEGNNATFAQGWEGVTGYGPTPIDRVLRFLAATWTGAIAPPRPLNEDENFPRFRTDSPLTPLLGSPVLATRREASTAPILRQGDLRLYRMPSLPRVFWTGAVRTSTDERAVGWLPRAAQGVLAVLPEAIPSLPPGDESSPVAAENIAVRANSLDAELRAPADGVAVVLDPFFPGWHASIDGVETPLLRADVAFSAVQVSKGQHHLHLWYFPDRLLPGLAVAAAAAVLLALLCHFASRRVDTPPIGG